MRKGCCWQTSSCVIQIRPFCVHSLNTLTRTAQIHIYSSHCISVYSGEEQNWLWFELSLFRAEVRLRAVVNTVTQPGPPQGGGGSTCSTARSLSAIILLCCKGRGSAVWRRTAIVLIYNLRTKLFTLLFHSSLHVLRNVFWCFVFTFYRWNKKNNHVYQPSADTL